MATDDKGVVCFAGTGEVHAPGCPATESGFKKDDSGKASMGLVAPHFLLELATVLTKGAVKYSRGNYLKGAEWHRYHDAALRHLNAWAMGEDTDAEFGTSPLINATACLMILSESQRLGIGVDDRAEIHGGKNGND